ncbi:hypothetical protein E3T61_15010 [Cryobacterium lactosi]|uniref:Uncharacterized protein n=1 Tax=Cryobacterium lactosi TaxID=1259202 RepID=A0A4R9BMG3_9MICO|nr:hypothetical protein [Cryobacterium lactosi]TFD87148.1 hypothetical protein E3T61_15010 [Cryobacterium lactosi]
MTTHPFRRGPRSATAVSAHEVRVVLTAACRIGDRTLQMHITNVQAARADPDEARWMRARLWTARSEARAELTAALEPSWWDGATPESIEATYQAARVWSPSDPVCAELEDSFAAMVHMLYGVCINEITALADARS